MGSWLTAVGEALDVFLNALLLWFLPPQARRGQTISEHAAEAWRLHRRWGCVLCRWLSWSVEQDHCGKMLRGVAITRVGALRAGLQLLVALLMLHMMISLLIRIV